MKAHNLQHKSLVTIKIKRVGKITTVKVPKETGFIGAAIPFGLSEQVGTRNR